MSNYPMMSESDKERAPFNEVEEKKTVRKKISVVLTKEIEVKVNANTETDNNEILEDYICKYASPHLYINLCKLYTQREKDKAVRLNMISLANTYEEDLRGMEGWEVETTEIDDAE